MSHANGQKEVGSGDHPAGAMLKILAVPALSCHTWAISGCEGQALATVLLQKQLLLTCHGLLLGLLLLFSFLTPVLPLCLHPINLCDHSVLPAQLLRKLTGS